MAAAAVQPRAVFGRPATQPTMGLLGVPGSGKSLTQHFLSGQVPDPDLPEKGADVPDDRFDKICSIYQAQKEVRAVVRVMDNPGVQPETDVLNNLASVDGFFHICRAFTPEDGGDAHPAGDIDPVRDLAMIKDELIKKDSGLIKAVMEELQRQKRQQQLPPDGLVELAFLAKAKETLDKGTLIVSRTDWTAEEVNYVEKHRLLSAKTPVYLVNLSEKDFIKKKNKFLMKIHAWIQENAKGAMIPYCAEFEMKLAKMATEEERQKYIESVGAQKSMAERIVKISHEIFAFQTFFTCGAAEVRAWTVPVGARALQAAGAIHPEMERGLLCIELFKLSDLVECGSEDKIKAEGKFMQKNKDYELEEGDIIFFKFKLLAPAK